MPNFQISIPMQGRSFRLTSKRRGLGSFYGTGTPHFSGMGRMGSFYKPGRWPLPRNRGFSGLGDALIADNNTGVFGNVDPLIDPSLVSSEGSGADYVSPSGVISYQPTPGSVYTGATYPVTTPPVASILPTVVSPFQPAPPVAPAAPTSWLSGSTVLFGTSVSNETLALGAAAIAAAVALSGGKKGRR